MAKIKFINNDKLQIGNISLKTIISLTNKNQTGEGFDALIDQVIISYPFEINCLEIILSTELYRHYYGTEKAHEIANAWIDNNKKALEKLDENNVPYTISSWQQFLMLSNYQTSLSAVKQLYEIDKCFLILINQLAEYFSQKMEVSLKNTIDFLLEECSVSLLLKGYVAYPHKEINSAITYTLNRLGKSFTYIAYTVDYRKNKSGISIPDLLSRQHPLYQQLLSLHTCLEQHGIIDRANQIRYFDKFLRSLEKKDCTPYLNYLTNISRELVLSEDK